MQRKRAEQEAQDIRDEISGHRRTIVVDWDGTLVPASWPDKPMEWMPGAERALRDMLTYANVVVCSARTNPYEPGTNELRPAEVTEAEIAYIRNMLDRYGFTQVHIWTMQGKPTGDAYIDDKAERYNGRQHSWDKLRRKLRMRFQIPDAAFPPWGPGDTEDE